jgi:hypothetical protein
MLNISVDIADMNPEHIPENLSINDQESIVEIIIEKILGFEDAIKEYDDVDTEDHNSKTNVQIDLTTLFFTEVLFNQLFHETTEHYFPNYIAHLKNGFLKLDIPPPKV